MGKKQSNHFFLLPRLEQSWEIYFKVLKVSDTSKDIQHFLKSLMFKANLWTILQHQKFLNLFLAKLSIGPDHTSSTATSILQFNKHY